VLTFPSQQDWIDICFELRLKPDLALYTRAMVNLTLANACPVEVHPDKDKFVARGAEIGGRVTR
jgi:hypothetical protein